MAPRPRSAVERLLERREIDPATGCWLYRTKRPGDGYLQITVDGVLMGVHRFAYSVFVGPLVDGLQIDHLCRRKRCFRPDHLEQVTALENTMRSEAITAENARKTHCTRGHALSGSNLYERANGWRDCRRCRADASRRQRCKKAIALATGEPIPIGG